MTEPLWTEAIESLRGRQEVPAAQATARLLTQAEGRWSGRVVPRTSMHDLLFTAPGQQYPFEGAVRVSWADDVFEFRLTAERGKLVTADRCHEPNAPLVLESFLVQLVGDHQ